MALAAAWQSFLDATERDWARFRDWPEDESAHFSEDGKWQRLPVRKRSSWLSEEVYEHGNWTAGFTLGTGALLWAERPDPELEAALRRRLELLSERADDTTTHDLGYLFHPSFAVARAVGLLDASGTGPASRAALTLARRFNPWGGFLQAFGPIGDERSAGTSTVDTMMNLPLLWWAGREAAKPRLFEIAHRHAQTTSRALVREDGSTYHLAKFDPLSGALLWRGTYQGAGGDSCWSRGQAWTACGAAWAFAATGDPELLDLAERSAAYFWERLPADGIPPWDFAQSGPAVPADASAGAIAALAAVILARAHPAEATRRRYGEMAGELLVNLVANALNNSPDVEGVLLRSCYSRPHGLGLDGAMAWGDFYLGLALAASVGAIDLAELGCPVADEGVSGSRHANRVGSKEDTP